MNFTQIGGIAQFYTQNKNKILLQSNSSATEQFTIKFKQKFIIKRMHLLFH